MEGGAGLLDFNGVDGVAACCCRLNLDCCSRDPTRLFFWIADNVVHAKYFYIGGKRREHPSSCLGS